MMENVENKLAVAMDEDCEEMKDKGDVKEVKRGRKHYSDTRINAYATAIMALLTLCALCVSLVESHKNQRQRVTELELTRVQHELAEVKKVSFELINNGIYEYVLDLSNNLMYREDFEDSRRRLDELSTNLERKCNMFSMTITPFGIPTKVEDGADVYEISNALMTKLYNLQSFLSFFVDVSKVKDKGDQMQLVKEYMDFVELSPVRVNYDENWQKVEEEYEISFREYCERCGYDFKKIKLYISVYLGSTVDDIFEEKVALYDYVSNVWTGEVDKLNGIYERLGMSTIENVMRK